jgi:AhpD family alkylhydroperoxidase
MVVRDVPRRRTLQYQWLPDASTAVSEPAPPAARAAASGQQRDEPRIAPGTPAEIGPVNFLIARALGIATGGNPPNLFTTLARHRRLFRPWLRFAATLMPRGMLPRVDSELVILRVAHNTDCEYEWRHHERLALISGLTAEEVQRVREDGIAPSWSDRHRLLLRAVDELHADREISSGLWNELRPLLRDDELIELCMLAGHYEMLAMTLNTLRIAPDPLPDEPPLIARAIRRWRR